jgi:hypothetical protein
MMSAEYSPPNKAAVPWQYAAKAIAVYIKISMTTATTTTTTSEIVI